ncbi:MAG: N-acetyltransferase family protein [Saprospiraceae bacterium]
MADLKSYPIRFIEPVQLKDGTLVQLRPVHPLDGKSAKEFRGKLSAESVYDRFLGYIPKISEKLVDRLTNIDYSREMAIVAEVHNENEKEVIAVGRIASDEDSAVDFAIIIADNWQGKGLGTILTAYLIDVAKEMEFEKIYATVFTSNKGMLGILRRKKFTFRKEDEMTTYAELILK